MRISTTVRLVAVLQISGLALLTCLSAPQAAEGPGSPERKDRFGNALPPDAIARLGPIRKRHSNKVNCVCFCLDGKRAISGSYDGTLALWDVESGKRIRAFGGVLAGATSLCLSPDGKQVISGSDDKTLSLWDVETGKRIRTFKGHSDDVRSVCFSPDGKRVISGSADKTLALWDVESGNRIHAFAGRSGVTSVCFSPDGKRVISGAYDDTLSLWDVETGRQIRTLKGHSSRVTSVCFSPDGKRAVSGSFDRTLALWDLYTGTRIRTFEGHSSMVTSVCFSPDGKRIISGCHDKTLALWDVESGKRIQTFSGHSKDVTCVRFSPSGRRIISGSSDTTLLVWQPFLSEMEGAREWAKETRRLPEAERQEEFRKVIRKLTSKDYRELCRSRERILAAGPDCLDLLPTIFPPEEAIPNHERKQLQALLQRFDSEDFGIRAQAHQKLMAYGARIVNWVIEQQQRKDLSAEVRLRLKQMEDSIRKNAYAVRDVGRMQAVLLLIEIQDCVRLNVYAKGIPWSCDVHLARRVCGHDQ